MTTSNLEENTKNKNQFSSPEEEEKYYKDQTDALMNDTLDSSRRILKKLDQTEQIALQNMNILAEDEERLQRINAKTMNINDETNRANQHISRFNKYNKNFMLPSFDFSTEEGQQKKDQKLKEKIKGREEEAKIKSEQNIQRIQNDINSAYSKKEKTEDNSSQGKLFSYNKDHAASQEIENNLDEMSDRLQKMKLYALSMNQTINEQNELISNSIVPNMETANSKIDAANQRIKKF